MSAKLTENISADAPSVFVGHYGYPKVNIGFLTPPQKKEDTWLHDAPRTWSRDNYSIPQVIDYRSSLINSKFSAPISIKNYNEGEIGKLISIAQEVSQSRKPVDLEINLTKKPHFSMSFDSYMAPLGPQASAVKVQSGNAHIDTQIEKRVNDVDLHANTALQELSQKGYDEHFLTRLLSMGNLGIGKNRTLVPTRWSITAVDDSLSKHELENIKDYEHISECTFYFGGYLGNYYAILLFPGAWQYELFEMYVPKNQHIDTMPNYSTDYESYHGRTAYAQNTVGGYYATRLPIVQHLKKLQRQAGCLAFRFITEEYNCPLGVWVVREAVRKALENKEHRFETRDSMLGFVRFLSQRKFNVSIDMFLKKSILYTIIKNQTTLGMFTHKNGTQK